MDVHKIIHTYENKDLQVIKVFIPSLEFINDYKSKILEIFERENNDEIEFWVSDDPKQFVRIYYPEYTAPRIENVLLSEEEYTFPDQIIAIEFTGDLEEGDEFTFPLDLHRFIVLEEGVAICVDGLGRCEYADFIVTENDIERFIRFNCIPVEQSNSDIFTFIMK